MRLCGRREDATPNKTRRKTTSWTIFRGEVVSLHNSCLQSQGSCARTVSWSSSFYANWDNDGTVRASCHACQSWNVTTQQTTRKQFSLLCSELSNFWHVGINLYFNWNLCLCFFVPAPQRTQQSIHLLMKTRVGRAHQLRAHRCRRNLSVFPWIMWKICIWLIPCLHIIWHGLNLHLQTWVSPVVFLFLLRYSVSIFTSEASKWTLIVFCKRAN